MKTPYFFALFCTVCVVSLHNALVPMADRWLLWLPYCETSAGMLLFALFGKLVLWFVRTLP